MKYEPTRGPFSQQAGIWALGLEVRRVVIKLRVLLPRQVTKVLHSDLRGSIDGRSVHEVHEGVAQVRLPEKSRPLGL